VRTLASMPHLPDGATADRRTAITPSAPRATDATTA
jgi:hypothetical protein